MFIPTDNVLAGFGHGVPHTRTINTGTGITDTGNYGMWFYLPARGAGASPPPVLLASFRN